MLIFLRKYNREITFDLHISEFDHLYSYKPICYFKIRPIHRFGKITYFLDYNRLNVKLKPKSARTP